jgi:hypothetical protein
VAHRALRVALGLHCTQRPFEALFERDAASARHIGATRLGKQRDRRGFE